MMQLNLKPLLKENVCFPTPHFFRDSVNCKLRKKEETHMEDDLYSS